MDKDYNPGYYNKYYQWIKYDITYYCNYNKTIHPNLNQRNHCKYCNKDHPNYQVLRHDLTFED